jgi:hypothetical protein
MCYRLRAASGEQPVQREADSREPDRLDEEQRRDQQAAATLRLRRRRVRSLSRRRNKRLPSYYRFLHSEFALPRAAGRRVDLTIDRLEATPVERAGQGNVGAIVRHPLSGDFAYKFLPRAWLKG